MANLVQYTISLKDKLTAPFQRATQQVQRFKSTMKDVNTTASKASGGVGLLSGAVGTLGGLFAAGAIMAGVKQIATLGMELEQARVRFEVFTGSAEKGNATIAELQKFAISTPFDDKQVLKAGQSLLAFGIDADKLTEKMQTLGNISAATGKDFNELVSIYGKNKLSGIIQAEDLNQLTEAGIDVYTSLSKQMGVSTSQVKKMGSEGKISFQMLEKSFEELGGKQGKWGDMMDKQSKTFGGRLSSLIGVAQNLGGELGEMMNGDFFGKLVDSATSFLYFVKDNNSQLGELFTPLKEAFQPIIDAFADVAEMMGITGDSGSFLKTVFNGIATAIHVLSPFIKAVATLFGVVFTKIFEVASAMKEWYERTQWVQDGVKKLYLHFKFAFENIATLAGKIFGGIGDIIKGVFDADWSTIKKGVSSIGDGLNVSDEEIAEQRKRFESEFNKPLTVDLWGKTKTATQEATTGGTTGGTTTNPNGKADAETNTKLSSAIDSASGSKSNTYNINITKLIENYTNQFTNVQESKEVIKNMVLQALTGAVSDLTTNLN